jgi:hypothetical protein
VGVGKGAAARHDIAQAATTRAVEFAGRGDWSARTCMLKWQGGQQCWLRSASEWKARGGDSSQGTCLGMVVHGNVVVRSCSDVHTADGVGGLRHNEEELGGARGS